ncbi:hypothetical protein ABW22_05975 [Thiobacillus denitrificans]|uniref:Uncharacterized protein n=1 Tax=Thiobacillus denitrificans TaxID=36861 RepID=A0A106BR37_THIDE|nr:hypothetical protein ABW22_05975 [Thiobacillus denitrificans]
MIILLFNLFTQTRAGSDKPPAKVRISVSFRECRQGVIGMSLLASLLKGKHASVRQRTLNLGKLAPWPAAALITSLLRGGGC